MARLDPFIELIFQEPGARLVLLAGHPAVMRGSSGERAVIKRALTGAQIASALSELLPEDMRRLAPGQGGRFSYRAKAGAVEIRIEQRASGIEVVFAQESAESFAGTEPEPEQLPESSIDPDPPTDPVVLAPPGVRRSLGIAVPGYHEVKTPTAAIIEVKVVPVPPPRTVNSSPAPQDAADAMVALLNLLLAQGGSDLHLSSNSVPGLRIDGDIVPVEGFGAPTSDRLREMLWSIAPERYRKEWQERSDTDFAHEIPEARFRVNIFSDRNGIGAVLRTIPLHIRTAEEMQLSRPVLDLCGLSKGLVLVTGPTGSGKSTTLAAMIDYINRNRDDHIITIEDPIEFVHPNKHCIVNQREIGTHTSSFKTALRAALREDPDVVLVGEMRDLETISIALETAETGHLVFGTLHTNTAPSTIDRIIDQFPADRQAQIRAMLSESLKGVITQVLCRKIGGGRVPAQEVLISNSAVANLIREGKTFQIPSIMQTGRAQGMMTMNDALLELVRSRQVLPKDALAKAVAKSELKAALDKLTLPPDLAEVAPVVARL